MNKSIDFILKIFWGILGIIAGIFVLNNVLFLFDFNKYSRVLSPIVIEEMRILDEDIDKYSCIFPPIEIERMKTLQSLRKRDEIHGKYVIDKRTYNYLNSKAKRILDNKNYHVQDNFDSLHTALVYHGNHDSLSLYSIEIKKYPSFCIFTEKWWQGMLSGLEDRKAFIYVFGVWVELKSFRLTSFY